jgi:predicted NUDIX family phosphoesterase
MFSKGDQAIIDREWKIAIRRSKKIGAPLYNGDLYRLRSWRCSNKKLHIELSDTNYKEYVGTRSRRYLKTHSIKDVANPLAVCACVITSDDKIIIGRRKKVDVYENRLHVIGGFVDAKKDSVERIPKIFHAIKREIVEEIGIDAKELNVIRCLGLVYDKIVPHPEMTFLVTLNLPSSEVQSKHPTDIEMGQVEFVKNTLKSLQNFVLYNHESLTPNGEANLLLYIATKYGEKHFLDLVRKL